MNKYLRYIESSDNEIDSVYQEANEYIIKINLWDKRVCHLKTVNCRKICFNEELVPEIFDIIANDCTYKFMTLDNEEIVLEIIADDIIMLDWNEITKNKSF